jgi:pimeloyl-ACP methyl ester carboxylesterase
MQKKRAAIEAFTRARDAFTERWLKNLKSGVRDCRFVDLPGAGHYLFLTRESEVLQGVRAFVASLK